ncbi:poly(A)-specific ribonuclease PARN-like [Amphiura filiformis]|uniref:poly(A)-specific ribonuclease PARN-like n=1 Tax=Amphiura filiformis TaxID=82378 RepID=UPI003B225AD0
MDVTKTNFKSACRILTDVIKHSSFVAIDGEFTGLHNYVNPNAFDTPTDRYHKLRQGSMDFLLVQFGVCVFKYDGKNSRYVAHPFNFYVFPRPTLRDARDQRFLCQSSSMDFLASHGFDFNKVFREGIPYLTPSDKERMLELVRERHNMHEQGLPAPPEASPAFVSPAAKKPMEIPEKEKDFVNGVIKLVEDFINDSGKQTLSLEPCNGFRRKLTYQAVRSKFTSGLHLDTQTGENKNERFIMIRKAGEEDQKKLEQQRLKSDLDEVDEAAGFARVIQILSESGKLIIGHNMLLDIMHTLHQFSCPLPESLNEFKALATCVFPKLIDTKVMASNQPFKNMIPSTALNDLWKHLDGNQFNKPQFEVAQNYTDYTKSEQFHDAGYDAFITGQCFATMANYLGTFMTPPQKRVSPSSQLLEPFLNKVCMFRVQDIPYMNLTGKDLQPSRAHVFHVTFPQEWKGSDLYQLFGDFGPVYIGWIDSTTAFVSLSNQDRADSVLKGIEPSPLYQVISYKQYREQFPADPQPALEIPAPYHETATVAPPDIKSPPDTGYDASSSRGSRGVKRHHDSGDSTDADREVAELMHGKKHKAMDPNAKPFVSRITPPPAEQDNKDKEITPKKIDGASPNESTKKHPDKLFEEPTTW